MKNIPTSTLIYVNDIGTGTASGIAVNVDAVGYYYFDGTNWVKLNPQAAAPASQVNIYNSDGTIDKNRTVTMNSNNLTFNATTGNFQVSGTNDGITRSYFRNLSTGANSRSDINIGANSANIYLGVDNGAAIFGAGVKGYLDNRSGGRMVFGNNGNEHMTIDNLTGNVGIGNSAPHAPLQFTSNVANRKIVMYETGNNDHQFYGLGVNPGVFRYQADALTTDHVFYAASGSTASNELMRIKGTGNVGIGTSAPNAKLHVVSSSPYSAFQMQDGSQGANKVLISDASGKATWATSSSITPTALGTVNTTTRTVSNYSLIGSTVTLTPGRWLVYVGQVLTTAAAANSTNNLWVRITLSSSSSSISTSNFTMLASDLASGWLSPSISVDGGYSFLSGVIPVQVNSTVTLYTWFDKNSPAGTPPAAQIGNNRENYFFAIPMN